MRWTVSPLCALGLGACTPPTSELLPTDRRWAQVPSTDVSEQADGGSGFEVPQPTEEDGEDIADTADTGDGLPEGYAWEDASWWSEPGPLHGLFDLELSVSRPHWRFWYITSPDLETWSDPVVLGHNFSSMDLLHLPEGLILSGSLIPNIEAGIEGPFGAMFSLVTTDLSTWGTHFLAVEGADELPMIIDPSIHAEVDGYRMLFFGSGLDVDPEAMPDDYPNPHYIRTGFVRYDRIVVDSLEPIVEGDHIVDPTGCWWNGVHHILATNKYGDLFHQYRREGATDFIDGLDWGGVQVPYCFIDEQNDRMGLLAQHGGGHGPPRVRWCDASGECAEQEALVSEEELFVGQCTSPVMAWFQDQYVLFCSSWYEGD